MRAIQGLILLIVIGALYFLPYIVAKKRKHQNAEAIGILNLLAGWTAIGWIIAIVWSATNSKKS